MRTPAPSLPPSQRTTYQFPVYRWIGWLTVAGFAAGLTVMFFISGMFGIPAPLGWAALVIVFTVGTLLLDRPKMLLGVMLFYFLLMPGNRVFGLVGLPLPTFLDELFFLPLIAVIVMNWIQRRQLREATVFPLVFGLVAALSWYVNRPSLFTAVQVTLIMLKSYILWYYCRLTCTFENERQLLRWVWIYCGYAAVQFFYNVLWQQGIWLKFHPDASGGVFGPAGAGGAHIVGYISIFALLLIAGWWVGAGRCARPGKRRLVLLMVVLIAYDLIFMTDTKHGLVLMPIVFLPFLLHPQFPARLRVGLLAGAACFLVASFAYFQIAMGGTSVRPFFTSFAQSPKGQMLYAVTVDFRHLVPYTLLGAGPGRFASQQAVESRMPLARRYIIPYMDEQRRLGYFSGALAGVAAASSILGIPNTDLFVLMGEFGWLGALAYYAFLVWVATKLWRKSRQHSLQQPATGFFIALCSCLIFFAFTTTLLSTATVPVLAFPLWILIGRTWDMRLDEPTTEPA